MEELMLKLEASEKSVKIIINNEVTWEIRQGRPRWVAYKGIVIGTDAYPKDNFYVLAKETLKEDIESIMQDFMKELDEAVSKIEGECSG